MHVPPPTVLPHATAELVTPLLVSSTTRAVRPRPDTRARSSAHHFDDFVDDIDRVSAMIRFLAPALPPSAPCHAATHLGAVLADAALQAGVKYDTVVRPRVMRLLAEHPEAATRIGLEHLLSIRSPEVLLRWRHPEKPRRFVALVAACADARVNSVGDLATWLATPRSRDALLAISGIGPKTIDYLHLLAGHAVIPMDRHLFRLLRLAGVPDRNYDSAQRTLTSACEAAGFPIRETENSLWRLFRDCSR